MNRRSICITACLALVAGVAGAQEKPRKSPHDKATVTLAGKQIMIEYGRPYLRGRKAVGGTLVPYGQVWRLGADEATKLTTPVDLTIGDLKVPAGSYALFTEATSDGWTLIVNKTAEQWGAFSYDKTKDLGRTALTLSKPPSTVEQFTISWAKAGDNSATLTLAWENTVATVNVTAQ